MDPAPDSERANRPTVERNILLRLAYEGSDFHGWQVQPGLRTVQQEVKNALQRLVGHVVNVAGASRTDTGVHARGQVANVRTTCPIPLANFRRALAHRLPADIEVTEVRDVPLDFHASRDATAKLYRYRIWHSELRPVYGLARHFAWHVWTPLDVERMASAAAALVGRHDFAGFATAGSPRATTVRTIDSFLVHRDAENIWLEVIGDGFLYNQVRNMVGTLVEIGRGRWPVDRVAEILEQRDRRLAGPTAPPQGLCLEWIRYDPGSLGE